MELLWHGLKVEVDVCALFGLCSLIYFPLAVYCVLSCSSLSLTLTVTVVLGVSFDAFSFAVLSPAEYASVLYTF